MTLTLSREQIVSIFNQGYNKGHHDTVEGCYVDVLPQDIETYHSDVVAEIVSEIFIDSFDRK